MVTKKFLLMVMLSCVPTSMYAMEATISGKMKSLLRVVDQEREATVSRKRSLNQENEKPLHETKKITPVSPGKENQPSAFAPYKKKKAEVPATPKQQIKIEDLVAVTTFCHEQKNYLVLLKKNRVEISDLASGVVVHILLPDGKDDLPLSSVGVDTSQQRPLIIAYSPKDETHRSSTYVWDFKSGTLVSKLQDPSHGQRDQIRLAVSPDGTRTGIRIITSPVTTALYGLDDQLIHKFAHRQEGSSWWFVFKNGPLCLSDGNLFFEDIKHGLMQLSNKGEMKALGLKSEDFCAIAQFSYKNSEYLMTRSYNTVSIWDCTKNEISLKHSFSAPHSRLGTLCFEVVHNNQKEYFVACPIEIDTYKKFGSKVGIWHALSGKQVAALTVPRKQLVQSLHIVKRDSKIELLVATRDTIAFWDISFLADLDLGHSLA